MNNFRLTILRLALAAAILTAAILPQAAAADVRYVKSPQPGGSDGSGSSWFNASGDLQKIINASSAGDEIWVFEGTYIPIYTADGWNSSSPPSTPTPDNRSNAFVLKEGVKIYGGFNSEVTGTMPTFGATGRDGESTLSGDLGIPGDDTDNACHVVIGAGIPDDGETVLDGFTVSDGNASGSGSINVNGPSVVIQSYGGGIYNYDASPRLTDVTISGNRAGIGGGICNYNSSSPQLTRVTISGNRANSYGGGIYNYDSSPRLTDVIIRENIAGTFGGGIYNYSNSSPVLTRVTISKNEASSGGGIYNDNSSPQLTDVTISENKAVSNLGGGIANISSSSPQLTRVTISENRAVIGGGICNDHSSLQLTGVTISKNTVTIVGGGIYNDNSSLQLTDVDISGNETTAFNSGGGGGGIFNFGSSPVNLTRVAIRGNQTASSGGGIRNAGSALFLTGVDISGNSADLFGGGIYNDGASPALTNVTISGNRATSDGGGIYNVASSPVLTNTVIWGNSTNVSNDGGSNPVYAYSLVEGETLTGTGNLAGAADPLFVSPADASLAPTVAGDYRLQAGSPVSNAGDNTAYLTARGLPHFTGETDLAGQPRLMDGIIDLGAYEYAPSPAARYVKENASGSGASWDEASGDLQKMINISNPGDTIWVAAGEYKPEYTADGWNGSAPYPSADDTRNNAFVLKAGVKIYGGFTSDVPAGTVPTFGAAGRDGVSTLSGDLGTPGDDTDNACHVVIGAGIPDNGATVLDGFTVSGGYAYGGSGYITVNGQNVYNNDGGGICNYSSSPVLTNVSISGNMAGFYGGGIYNYHSSSPRLTNVTISGNRAIADGGGIFNDHSSSPRLTNVTISGNRANLSGGGIYNNHSSSPRLTNVTISGNRATVGGGICNGNSSSPHLTNTIVWGNSTGIQDYDDSATDYAYSLVQEQNPGGTNLDGTDAANDPLFASPAEFSDAPTTAGDYRLQAGSPVIDRGDNAAYLTARGYPGSPLPNFTGETDLAGLPRLIGDNIEPGAYEYDPVPAAPENFTATPGNAQVKLEWTAPPDNGGTPVTGYEISINSGPWIAVPELKTDTLITGLTNGTPYTFQVRAINAAGEGAETTAITATPRTVPDAPTGFTATPGDTQVALSWTAPPDNGGTPVTGYEVSINSGPWVAVPELKMDTLITGLTNGTPYTFQVHAINAAGEGAPATITATTPKSYGIILSQSEPHTFPFDTYGYDALAPLTVTVTNTGTQPTGPLTATLTGATPGAFRLSSATLGSIPTGGSSTFTLAPATGLNAGDYSATVTVSGANGSTAGFGVSFTVDKAKPTLAELDFTLGDIVCSGVPYPIPVTPAKDIEGLGEITVYYNGITTVPVDPGEYAVTIDIAEGANYIAVTGLPLGVFTIQEPPIPVPTRYSVLLPSVAGLTTDPPAGKYYVNGGTNFTFTLTPDVPSADGTPPQVQTNRPVPDLPNASGIRITPNADGSYTVVIIGIRQDIEIILAVADSKSDPTDNESVGDAGLEVYTAPGAIVVANSRSEAATLRVYNLAGTLVRLATVLPGTTRLAVSPGIYIVTDGGAFRRKTAVLR